MNVPATITLEATKEIPTDYVPLKDYIVELKKMTEEILASLMKR